MTNQALQTETSFIVHPSSLYVGISTQKTYGKPNEIIRFEVIVCDIDGQLVEGIEVQVKSVLEWNELVEGNLEAKRRITRFHFLFILIKIRTYNHII
jgi:hypothetical protein